MTALSALVAVAFAGGCMAAEAEDDGGNLGAAQEAICKQQCGWQCSVGVGGRKQCRWACRQVCY